MAASIAFGWLIRFAAVMVVVGCSNALNYDVAKLTHEQRVFVQQVLTADQLKNLDEWIDRNALAGKDTLPPGVTVGQALKDQAGWRARQRAEEAKADELKQHMEAERAAKQAALAKLLSLTFVSKTNKVLRDDQKIVVFEIAYENKTDKDIQEVKAVLKLASIYGEPIIDISWSYTGGISARQTVVERSADIFISKSIDTQLKFWNTDFGKLKPQFEVNNIIFNDGTSISNSQQITDLRD